MQIRDLIEELKHYPETEEVLVRVTVGHATAFLGCADPEQHFVADRVERLPGEGVALHIAEE